MQETHFVVETLYIDYIMKCDINNVGKIIETEACA